MARRVLLILALVQRKKPTVLQSLHCGACLLLYLEEDLDGEPVCSGRVGWEACKVPPDSGLVKELPLSTMELGGSGAEEAVKEGCELSPGKHTGAVLEEEYQGMRRRPVKREEKGARRGCSHGSSLVAQVRNVVR